MTNIRTANVTAKPAGRVIEWSPSGKLLPWRTIDPVRVEGPNGPPVSRSIIVTLPRPRYLRVSVIDMRWRLSDPLSRLGPEARASKVSFFSTLLRCADPAAAFTPHRNGVPIISVWSGWSANAGRTPRVENGPEIFAHKKPHGHD